MRFTRNCKMKTTVLVIWSIVLIGVTASPTNVTERSNVMKIDPVLKDAHDEDIEIEIYDKKTVLPPDFARMVDALEILPNTLCKNDSRAVLEAAISRQRWALQMFDASPKFPTGMLYGSYYQLGNFDECVSVKETLVETKRVVQGQYCLADIVLDGDTLDGRIARSHGHFHDHEPRSRINFNDTLHWAICVPSSCGPKEVRLFLTELIDKAIAYRAIAIKVPKDMCYYEEDKPLDSKEIVYGCIIGAFCVLTLLATIYHSVWIYHRNRSVDYNITPANRKEFFYHRFALCFSMIQNVKKLLNPPNSDFNLDCISGIRFMSMALIIASHSLLFIIGGPVLNESFYSEAVQKPQNAILLNNPLLVDTFLLLSGFLMCRLLLLELEKRNGKINFIFIYVGRYIRLTPSYLVVIGLYCTILYRLDNGPLWHSIISTEQERCVQSWWANILYINNYVNTDNICMFQSWYLAVDTQLFIIAPFIIYPLWKWPRKGEILLAIVTVTAIMMPFIVTYIYGLDPTLMAYPSEMTDITRNYYYVFAYMKTHMRATSYCIGMVAGYIAYKLYSSSTKLSNNLVRSGWILSTVFGVSAVYSVTIFYLPYHHYTVLESATYSALHKLAWSVSIAWVIIACVTDNSGPVKKLLSWSLFSPLSRLTYCAYLINGLVELHGYGTLRSPTYMSVYNLASISLSHLVLTFAAGLVLCVLFESPIHGLERIMLRREPKKNNRTNTNEK